MHARSSAIVVGSIEGAVRELLADALSELRVDVHGEPGDAPVELVIAIVTRESVKGVLAESKLLAAHAPILAVTSLLNGDCEELALQGGAAAFWALEWPITRLRGLVEAMLVRRVRRVPP